MNAPAYGSPFPAGPATFAYDANGRDAVGRVTGIVDQFSDSASSNVWHSFAYNPASGIASQTRDNDAYA